MTKGLCIQVHIFRLYYVLLFPQKTFKISIIRRVGFSPVPTVAAESNRNRASSLKRSPSSANHNSRKHSNENADEFGAGDLAAETTPLTNAAAAASKAKVNTSDVKVINSLIEDLSRQDGPLSCTAVSSEAWAKLREWAILAG